MDLEMLANLLAFYNVGSILICTEDNDTITIDFQSYLENTWLTFIHIEGSKLQDDIGKVLDNKINPEGANLIISCESYLESMEEYDGSLFESNIVWLLKEDSLSQDNIDKLPLKLTSNLVTTSSVSNNTMTFHEHYAIKSSVRKSAYLGDWTSSEGLTVANNYVWDRRSDLSGLEILNTVLDWVPLIKTDSGTGRISGWLADIIHAIQKELKFSLKTIQPEDGFWGTQDADGEWNGMVAQLASKEADLCGATLTVTSARGQVMDFSHGLVEDVASLAVPNSNNNHGKEEINFTVYLSVFNSGVWLATFFVAITSTACYTFSQTAMTKKCPTKHFKHPLTFAFYEFFLSLIQRSDQNDGVSGLCNKIWFSSINLFAFFLFALYTGDLTASMTAAKVAVPLKTYQDVLERGYTVATDKGTAFHDLFKRAPEGTMLRKIYQSSFELMSDEEFYRLESFKHTLFTTQSSMFFQEDFVLLGDFEGALSTQLAFGFQKDSELKPIFDYHILKLKQSGVLDALESQWHRSRKPEDMSARIFQEEPITLGYGNLFFPMFVMFVGIVLGIMLACVEMQFDFRKATRWRQRSENPTFY